MRRLARLPILTILIAVMASACSNASSPLPDQTTATAAAAPLTHLSPATTTTSTPTTATLLPAVTPAPAPTPTPVRPDAEPFPDLLRQRAQDLLAQVSLLRDSPPNARIEMFLLSPDQARAFYSTDRSGDSGPSGAPGLDVKQEIYDLLGLAPKQKEIREAELDNLISLLTGFFSPELGALYLIDTINGGTDGPLALSTIVHELTHALQFQYYDIRSIAALRANDWDATTALLDVLEGDAVATEIQVLGFSTRSTYRQPICFAIPAPQRPGTPFIIERELDTWYEDGLCFVEAVLALSPGGIAAIFNNLPTTTEQILHPEKYLAGENAKLVTLASLATALGPNWSLLEQGTFGEFMLQNILLAGLPDDRLRAQAAAAGWGGDGWRFFSDGNARLLQSIIVWDSIEEAREFWRALVQSLSNRASGTLPPIGEDSVQIDLDGHFWRVTIDADQIAILVADDVTALERVAAAIARPRS